MSVIVWLASGERRVVAEADGADTDGFFVWFTARDPRDESDGRIVLTLRAKDGSRGNRQGREGHPDHPPEIN